MNFSNWQLFAIGAALTLLFAANVHSFSGDVYYQMCDASAAVAIDESHFIVANDEDNILRIYNINSSIPVSSFDVSRFLRIDYDDKSPESDVEGAARIDDYYVFITSHGRDKKGRLRRNRHQLFAVKIDKNMNIIPVGKPYSGLMNSLVTKKELKFLYNTYLPHDKKREELAPKKRGVNIEGLAVIPGTQKCIIGFRNPIPDGQALLVIFENPLQVLFNNELPEFGRTTLLPLGRRGIRDIVFHPQLQRYLILAGSAGSRNRSRLFVWSGHDEELPRQQPEFVFSKMDNFNPEALVIYKNRSAFQVFSDDGAMTVEDGLGGTCDCKELSQPGKKRFRGIWIKTSALQTD